MPLTFDREAYLPGEKAIVSFNSVSTGKGTLAVGDKNINSVVTFDVVPGSNKVEISIPANTNFGNINGLLTVVAVSANNKTDPIFSYGSTSIPVIQDKHKLNITIDAPENAKPKQTVTIKIKLQDYQNLPQGGSLQVWGVDKGILALTNYKTPAVFDYFFGKYSENWKIFSIYGALFPSSEFDLSSAIGGDKVLASPSQYFNEKSKNLFTPALFSLPTVKVDASGYAELDVVMPDHTGSIQIMALANNTNGVGSTQKDIILKDDISIAIGAPNFIAPNDECELNFSIFNHAQLSGVAQYSISLPETVKVISGETSGEFTIGPKENNIQLKLDKVAEINEIPITITVKANNQEFKSFKTITVRDFSINGTKSTITQIAPGESCEFVASIAGITGKDDNIAIQFYTVPVPEMKNALDILNDYPYGCLEQITAKAFPYLAINSLVKLGAAPEVFKQSADTIIAQTVKKLSSRMLYNGFSMWPGGEEVWLDGSLFASHFIAEAAQNGCEVDANFLNRIKHFTVSTINNRNHTIGQRAYAIYVNSLIKNSNYDFQDFSDGGHDFNNILLTAAHINFNNNMRTKDDFIELLNNKAYLNGDNSTIDSPVRRLGMTLYIAAKIIPNHPILETLADELSTSIGKQSSGWNNTQASNWAILGLASFWNNGKKVQGKAEITLQNGQKVNAEYGKNTKLDSKKDEVIKVNNSGDVKLSVMQSTFGRINEQENQSNGIKISRRYLNQQGAESNEFKRGELITVEVTVANTSTKKIENIIITDLLPGGFEIEDERLATRAAPINSSYNNRNSSNRLNLRFLERRNDRCLAFGDLYIAGKGVFTYQIRATHRGSFNIPSLSAEAMYDEKTNAFAKGEGKIIVE